MQPTLDPTITIVHRAEGVVHYRALDTGREWVVRGTCNQCGLCVVGAAHPEHYAWHGEPGTPYAVTDLRVAEGRLDEPVTPEFFTDMPRCVLSCEVLD